MAAAAWGAGQSRGLTVPGPTWLGASAGLGSMALSWKRDGRSS